MPKLLQLAYAPLFLRKLKKMDSLLMEDIIEKIEMFRASENHKRLKVHKLKGPLSDVYGFSVNYQMRIVFEYADKNTALLLTIGNHHIYQ